MEILAHRLRAMLCPPLLNESRKRGALGITTLVMGLAIFEKTSHPCDVEDAPDDPGPRLEPAQGLSAFRPVGCDPRLDYDERCPN